MKIYLIILLLSLSFENKIIEIPKYEEISINGDYFLYIKLDDFKSGDTIYFEISHDDNTCDPNDDSDNSIYIEYLEDNSNDNEAFSKPFEECKSNGVSTFYVHCNYNYYFSITLKNNYKYLLIKPNLGNYSNVKFNHTRINNAFYIFGFFILIAIIGLTIGIIICIKDAMKKKNISNDTNQMDTPLKKNDE